MTATNSNPPKTTAIVAHGTLESPYDTVRQPDQHLLWELLVARDSDAFAACDWSICAEDFAPGRFDGISANGSLDPAQWSLRYPTVESYRDDWLKMAEAYRQLQLTGISHRDFLYRMQTFARVESACDRAVVWKQFRADAPLTSGDRHVVTGQSVYRLHRIDGRWLIVGFVGYLPLESSDALG
jgi:hypothetical protein